MTKMPEATDELDAAAHAAVNGPADDTLQPCGADRTASRHRILTGLLEPGAVKAARRVLRRARAQQCARAYPTFWGRAAVVSATTPDQLWKSSAPAATSPAAPGSCGS